MLTKGGVIPHRKKVNYARSGKRRYFVQRCSHSVETSLFPDEGVTRCTGEVDNSLTLLTV